MLRYGLFSLLVCVLGLVAYDLGVRGARAYERMQLQRISNALEALGMAWASVEADGLQIQLVGHAPDLFAQELALESARATAPLAQISNYATATLAPPEKRDPVRIELHRDPRGITLIGQTASRVMRDELNRQIQLDAVGVTIRDLTGIQAAQPPRDWGPELLVASLAAGRLDDAYVLIEPGIVSIEGGVPDADTRDQITKDLLARAGDGPSLVLRLNIPAAVVAPFAFSAYKDPGGGIRLERCVARNADEQAVILDTLNRADVEIYAHSCEIGLGGPGGDWAAAVRSAIAGLAELPAGRADVEYRDVWLTGNPPTTPTEFGNAIALLTSTLPEGFEASGALRDDDAATLAGISRESYWMRLSRGDDGLALAGKVPEGPARNAIEIYAAAIFGGNEVHSGLQESADLAPAGWQVAAIRVLDLLGTTPTAEAEFTGHKLRLRAEVADPAEARVLHTALQDNLPTFEIETRISVDLPKAIAAIALPARPCAAALEEIVRRAPLDFDTGSAVIAKQSRDVLPGLADRLRGCNSEPIEIGGHTDSQGSEDLNQRISQARADAVRDALLDLGISLDRLIAKGYGESEPIAENETEAGRARNRRITFKPGVAPAPEAAPAPESAPEAAAAQEDN